MNASAAVRVRDGLLEIGESQMPLVAGEVQFWRLDPSEWGPVLDRVAAAGIRIVSTYLSWRRHEPEPGRLEWGAAVPQLDAAGFLRACGDRGLYVQLKPGPWICAEEPGGGYPDWLMAQTDDLALDASGQPIGGYNPPFVHPVPSPHSRGYRDTAQRWLGAVWDELGTLAYPDGPIIAVQLDNEPGYAFQDALYVADYHPAAIDDFRTWLSDRYGDVEAWHEVWGEAASADFATAAPPRPVSIASDPIGTVLTPTVPNDAAVRDWVAFMRDSIAAHLRSLWEIHEERGLGHLLATVNLISHPIHDIPVAHGAVRDVLPLAAVGGDLYYEPPITWQDVNRLALTAATARAAGEPVVWAPELMSGIWRSPGEVVGYPDPTPDEQAAWWGAALALGYQGFNLYMLADRENWALAPVSRNGGSTPLLGRAADLARSMQSEPNMVRAQPKAVVALLWDDEDALAAYRATGTARQPEVSWGSSEASLAYRETLRLGAELLAAGYAYELWYPRREWVPAGMTVVASAASRWFDEELTREVACRVAPGDELDPALIGPRPPAWIDCDDGAEPGGIATLHPSGDDVWLHVARWATGPAELVLAEPLDTGEWSPLLGAAEPLERISAGRWRLPPAAPHLVMRWTSRITHESAHVEEP